MNNDQKTPIVHSLTTYVRGQNESFERLRGQNLPVTVVSVDSSGTIVKVKFAITDPTLTFPDTTCPVATDRYARAPLQAGDPGYVVAADVYLGGVSGLGGGTATLDRLPNLSTLVFHPLGNTAFKALLYSDKYDISAPGGAYIHTDDGLQGVFIGPIPDGPKNSLGINGLIAAVDDADAKIKKVPILGLYHNAGAVRIRLV